MRIRRSQAMSLLSRVIKKAGLIAAGEAALGALALYAAESSGQGIRIGHDRKKPGFVRGVREAVANYVGEFHPEEFVTKEIPTLIRYMAKPTRAVAHAPLDMAQDHAAMPGTLVWVCFF